MSRFSFEIPPIRLGLYVVLTLFSFILFVLTTVRLSYTAKFNFYESYVAELIFTGIVTIFWCIFIIVAMFERFEFRFLTTFLGEIIVLVILWFFWIVGTGIASSSWQDLERCQRFEPCQILSALLGFAWLSWFTLTVLLVITVLFSVANRALQQPLHGRWDPRISMYSSRG